MNKPEIRFEGFVENWEQQKLGEVADIRTGPFGSTLHAEDYVKDGIPIITTEHFKTGQLPEKVINIPQVSENDYKRLQSYTLNKDDIVFSRVGSVDINALVTEFQNGWLFSGRVLRVRSYENINSQYLHYELSTIRAKNDVISRAVGQTMPSINTEILKDTNVCFPSKLPEQTAIGNFFRSLDNTIALKKQQCEQTANIKKAMLEKMFPKKGENVPEIRFDGFTGAWVLDELTDVLSPTVGNNTLSRADLNYESGEVLNIHYGDILIKFGSFIDSANDEIPFITNGPVMDYRNQLLQDGDIVFADTAEDETAGKVVEVTNSHGVNMVSGLHTMVYRPKRKFATYFMGYYLNSNSFRHQLLPLMQGAKVLSLSRSNLATTQLCYPSSLDEQAAIGNFFRSLDTLIEAQQQELEKLQNIKNAYLNKMFV